MDSLFEFEINASFKLGDLQKPSATNRKLIYFIFKLQFRLIGSDISNLETLIAKLNSESLNTLENQASRKSELFITLNRDLKIC